MDDMKSKVVIFMTKSDQSGQFTCVQKLPQFSEYTKGQVTFFSFWFLLIVSGQYINFGQVMNYYS